MSYEQELKDLCETYGTSLPEKILIIQTDWNQLKQLKKSPSNEMICKIHSLIGAGATFGFPSLSVVAKELELKLRYYQQLESMPPDYIIDVDPLIIALKKAAQQPCEYDIKIDANPTLKKTIVVDNNTTDILIITNTSSLNTDLHRELKTLKMRSHVVSSSNNLQSIIESVEPNCIVLELGSEQNPVDEIKSIKVITQKFYKAPALIVISSHHDMSIRLLAVKAGATAYFLAPVNISELVKSIHLQCHTKITPPYRILIVDDDDEQFAHHTALILQRAGTNMKANVIDQPLKIMESLQSFKPEVILLDLYMPECDGIELATVIRQQCIYAGIAIVFFSIETAIDRHIDALRAGGNDFLLKSMPANQLIAKIEAKASNARTIQSLT